MNYFEGLRLPPKLLTLLKLEAATRWNLCAQMTKMIHRRIVSTKTKNFTEVLRLSRGNQGSRKFKAGSYLPPPVSPEKFVLLLFHEEKKEIKTNQAENEFSKKFTFNPFVG